MLTGEGSPIGLRLRGGHHLVLSTCKGVYCGVYCRGLTDGFKGSCRGTKAKGCKKLRKWKRSNVFFASKVGARRRADRAFFNGPFPQQPLRFN